MNSGFSSTRTSRRRDSKSSIRRSLEARFRGARFKLEDLESRTLLSTTAKYVGPVIVPQGLGPGYTAIAEGVYGVGQSTTSPGQYVPGGTTSTNTTTPTTMAELQAYLKSLGLNYDKLTNAGAGVPTAYQNLVTPRPERSGSALSAAAANLPPTGNYYQQQPGQSSTGKPARRQRLRPGVVAQVLAASIPRAPGCRSPPWIRRSSTASTG